MSAAGPGPGSRRSREAARIAAEQAARRRRDRRLLLTFVVALVVLVVGGGIGLQAWRTSRAPSAVPVATTGDAAQRVTDGQPIRLGSDDAPVEVTLYEDFQCPHCADFEEEFGPTLTAAQDAGRARIELYPMSFVVPEISARAANAMACATEAGFGQPYYLGLFANHTLRWSDDQLIDLAGKVGGQADGTFSTCVTTQARAGWVSSINTAAQSNGVTGTPTMFVNGTAVDLQSLTTEKLQAMLGTATPAGG